MSELVICDPCIVINQNKHRDCTQWMVHIRADPQILARAPVSDSNATIFGFNQAKWKPIASHPSESGMSCIIKKENLILAKSIRWTDFYLEATTSPHPTKYSDLFIWYGRPNTSNSLQCNTINVYVDSKVNPMALKLEGTDYDIDDDSDE